MSDHYDRGGSSSRRRGGFGHWVPLVLTLTIATAGVAAWAWSQRNRDDDEYDDESGEGHENLVQHQHDNKNSGNSSDSSSSSSSSGSNNSNNNNNNNNGLDYEHGDYGDNPPYGASGTKGRGSGSAEAGSATSSVASGWSARMTGALSGSANPQQWVGSASKAVTAGVAAASAAVGGALASIREGDKDAYADHETWSEEADARKKRTTSSSAAPVVPSSTAPNVKDTSGRKRKTVAIVVSADNALDGIEEEGFLEHASILSYIPRQTDFGKVRIFVLIYAPGLKESAAATLDTGAAAQPASLSSSFSNIGPDQAQSPKVEAKSPAAGLAFNAVHTQALGLVEKESDIIPFTSPSGHAHILHLLEPDIVYLQESLTGDNGAIVNQLQNWMRNDIVVVVGAESGHGGLADSESEADKPGPTDVAVKWWQREDRVGRGRGVVVVDGLRVNDDWIRRVQGKE